MSETFLSPAANAVSGGVSADAPARPFVWRSLDEWAGDEEFLARVQKEFSPGAEFWVDQPSRRAFLQRMGAAFALAGLTGCSRQPEEQIVPYVDTPEVLVPGVPLMFATAMPQPGGALGLVVRTHEGRPTKVEGNALHPVSGGATDLQAQASILDLYDPHRSRVVRRRLRLASWADFIAVLQPELERLRGRQGAGLRILSGEILSPTAREQLGRLLEALPEARWHRFEPAQHHGATAGARIAFGRPLAPRVDLTNADVIVSLGNDFLGQGPARVRLAREFARKRRVTSGDKSAMSRIYVAESSPTITGAAADHRFALSPDEMTTLIVAIARELKVPAVPDSPAPTSAMQRWVRAIVQDLLAHRGSSVLLVGESLPDTAHALGYAINAELGNLGQTQQFLEPFDGVAGIEPEGLPELAAALDRGDVETVLILGVDAVALAPGDLKFAEKLKKASLIVHHGLHNDETAKAAHWHLPQTHFFEEWSDTIAEDGVVSLVQPLIAPLHDGRSIHEVLSLWLGESETPGYDIVRARWLGQWGENGISRWNQSLHDGIVAGGATPAAELSLPAQAWSAIAEGWKRPITNGGEFDLVFRLDPAILDGRHATNGWLQECPESISKLTWGNAVWISPATAAKLQVKSGALAELSTSAGMITAPLWIQPGQADGVATVFLGHGRKIDGLETVGVSATPLQRSDSYWHVRGDVRPTGEKTVLATTQEHHLMEGRDLIRMGRLRDYNARPADPDFMHVSHHGAPTPTREGSHKDAQPAPDGQEIPSEPSVLHDDTHEHSHAHERHRGDSAGRDQPTLYPDMPQDGPQWGMSIDLTACTGCNACVIACQSENNIPVVGADQIRRGREMHWLRIDSYYTGDLDNPGFEHQPVMCMHCEHAPCEPVCPVSATTHSDEGLNEMTYNRCVGTRYCSNNCPYKVRRFNFLDFRTDLKELPVLQLAQNPNVSVRSRGVMEKCTYCVQRISSARIQSKVDGRPLQDGDVVTACQSACPTQAIVFGDISDAASQVSQRKAHTLDFGLLTELNTRPRTTYLASLRNPHPELSQEAHA